MKKTRSLLLAALAALLLAGCAGRSEPTRWYALRGDPPTAAPAAPPLAMTGGEVWELSRTVRLPGALDRDTLMVESGAAGLQPLTGHRWAEPLRDSVPRLLLQDLTQLRGPARTWAAPAPPGVAVTRRLTVEVLVLQADAERRRVRLQARWWLEDAAPAPTAPAPAAAASAAGSPAPPAVPRLGEADLSVEIAGASVDALAAAHRQALWQLAQRLAVSP